MATTQSVVDNRIKTSYVLLMLPLIMGSVVCYVSIPWVLAIVAHRPVDFGQLARTKTPLVTGAVLWNDRLVVPHLEFNLLNPVGARQSLYAIDMKSHEAVPLKDNLPIGPLKLVVGEKSLWALAGGLVVQIDGDKVTESNPFRKPRSFDAVIEHEGRLLLFEQTSYTDRNGNPRVRFDCLEWDKGNWKSIGRLLLPQQVMKSLEQSGGQTTVSFSFPNSLRVHKVADTLHLFCSDMMGAEMHSTHLDVIPNDSVSALEPENSLTEVRGWAPTGETFPFSSPEPLLAADEQGLWKVLLTQQTAGLKMESTYTASRFVEGAWKKDREWTRKGLVLENQVVSDGQRAFLLSQTMGNQLQLIPLDNAQSKEARVTINPQGILLEKLSQTAQTWGVLVVIPMMILFAYVISKVMTAYRRSRYEFGKSNVELASVLRRSIAKGIDSLLINSPVLVVQYAWLGSPSEVQKKMMDNFFSGDFDGLALLVYVLFGILIYYLIWLLVIGWLEGKWGISPGKWLCDIRVVRTTLRPCGLLRGVLRELLMIADFLVFWLPGACSVAFTSLWQRLGDLVADTIVIRNPATTAAEVTELAQVIEPQ